MKNKIVFLIITLILIIMLSACSNEQNEFLFKAGTYVSDGDILSASTLKLQGDNEFILLGPPYLNFAPTGKYSVTDKKLILTVSEEEKYIFSIKNGNLIFESGTWLENWVERGSEFHLSND